MYPNIVPLCVDKSTQLTALKLTMRLFDSILFEQLQLPDAIIFIINFLQSISNELNAANFYYRGITNKLINYEECTPKLNSTLHQRNIYRLNFTQLNLTIRLLIRSAGYFSDSTGQLQIMIFKLVAIFLALAIYCSAALSQLSNSYQLAIQGNTDEQIEVNFPVDQLLALKINDQSAQFAKVISKRFKLAIKKSISIQSAMKKTLLQELRSPFTNQYTLMFYINSYIVMFEMPNTFIIINQAQSSFSNAKQLKIPDILPTSTVYTIEEFYFIVAISAEQLIVLNQKITKKQANPFNTTAPLIIKSINRHNSTHFITICNNTLFFLEINTKGVISVIKYLNLLVNNSLRIDVSAIQRGQAHKNNEQFLILDQNRGLFVMVISSLIQVTSSPVLVQKQSGCFQLDTEVRVHSLRVLLTCRSKGNNNFIQLTYDNDIKAYPFLLSKDYPYDQKCSSDKYMFFKDYIVSEQSESLDIFVPDHSVEGKLKYKKHWVTLDGINSFLIRRDEKRESIAVYVGKNGVLQRRELQFQKPSLIINSQTAVSQTLPVTLEYKCKGQEMKIFQICRMEVALKVNIHTNILSYVQYKSINIGLILLLATVFAALVLLCRYKYNSIYQTKYQDLKELTNPQKYQL